MNCHVCRSEKIVPWGSKNGYALWRCNDCDLRFVAPMPISTSEVYGEDYFEGAKEGFGYVNYEEDKEPMIPAFNTYLERIRAETGKAGKLLDVGAATGFFVGIATKKGFNASGIELSAHAAEKGRQLGRNIRTGTLANEAGNYDIVTMLDLIEHLTDPRADLFKAAALLPVGGVLVINTPDAGSLFSGMLGLRWHLVCPPEHLYYFNRRNLARLLTECGFEIRTVTTIGKSFTLKYVFKTLYKWTKLSVFDALAGFLSRPRLSHISIPINLYDNMFVLARKR